MNTSEKSGKSLHDADAERRREGARALGSARTPKKQAAARENGKKSVFTEEMRDKLRVSQQARRERERQEKEAAGVVTVATEKKRPGRPRKPQEGTNGT